MGRGASIDYTKTSRREGLADGHIDKDVLERTTPLEFMKAEENAADHQIGGI